MQEIIANYVWLFTRWWFWLTFLLTIILTWYLFKRRVYKELNGKLFIRHGQLGKWIDIEEHLQKEHPEEWEQYKQTMTSSKPRN